jgi:hypothetical protein
MRRFLIVSALIVCATKDASPAGINLSWDDCGAAGNELATFACNTNNGIAGILVGSFVPPSGIQNFAGIVARATLYFPGETTVPDWWRLNDGIGPSMPPFCRDSTSVRAVPNSILGTGACAYPYGEGVRGPPYSAYTAPGSGLNRARLEVGIGTSTLQALSDAQEYYAFWVVIDANHTVDSGACAGCEKSVCIELDRIQLVQDPPDSFTLTEPINGARVGWQQAATLPCLIAVPTKNSTWGRVRSLYR